MIKDWWTRHIPLEVVKAGLVVEMWFAEQNIRNWQLGGLESRDYDSRDRYAKPMKFRVDLAHECFDMESPDEEEKNAGPRGLGLDAVGPARTISGERPDVDAHPTRRAEWPVIWGPGYGALPRGQGES